MAYIDYGQNTVGGSQVAGSMKKLRDAIDEIRNEIAWIGAIGVANLDTNTDFSVKTSDKQAFNDTLAQINTDLVSFMVTNREKIERLARG